MHRILLASLLLTTALDAPAQEGPVLRKGIWQLKKVVNQRPYDTRQCLEPWADLMRRQDELRESGCAYQVTRPAADRWQVDSRCDRNTSDGRRWESRTRTVLSVIDDTAYHLEVEGTTNTVPVRERIDARWTGPCTP